jgi:hypothetical protein
MAGGRPARPERVDDRHRVGRTLFSIRVIPPAALGPGHWVRTDAGRSRERLQSPREPWGSDPSGRPGPELILDGSKLVMRVFKGVWSVVNGCAELISKLFARPRLEFTYARVGEPDIVQVDDPKDRVAYYHIDVTNIGNRGAKDCQGFLDVVKTLKMANLYGGNLAIKPERLQWAHDGSGQAVNLNPHASPRKLQLFHVYENMPTNMHFPIKPPQTPVGTKTRVVADQYLLNVRLDYDSDRYFTVKLIVRPADRFDQFSIDVQT